MKLRVESILLAIALLVPFGCRSQEKSIVKGESSSVIVTKNINGLGESTKPKLVIGVVVDQMRYDYLSRFAEHFVEDGFNRFLRRGFVNKNTHYNYIPTFTGPGHASVFTGTTPATHGIIGNDWYSRKISKSVYCVEDSSYTAVGSNSKYGSVSPHRLLSTTITDELKLSNVTSKVVGISIKDRGAALPAGHMPDGAYWYDRKYGKFITSTYYMTELPAWVKKFNDRKLAAQYLDSTWTTLHPMEAYIASGKDDSPYERVFKGKEKATFPYNLAELKKANGNYDLLTTTPFGNTLVIEMAMAAIEGEQMGQDDVTDILTVSFSSTDILGHGFGLRSVELQDMYLRLDREFARFFKYLDAKVGEGNYLIYLTADHAAVDVPQYSMDKNLPGGYFQFYPMIEKLQAYLTKEYGVEGLVEYGDNDQVYLNHERIRENKLKLEEVREVVAAFIKQFDGVVNTFTAHQMEREEYTTGVRHLLQMGYYPPRSGDVLILLKPGWIDQTSIATTHGSGYNYDTHVPLLWYGWGVRAGASYKRQTITDIVPTVSFMLGIPLPSGASGEPILELLEAK